MAQMFAIGAATTGFGGAALSVLYQFVPDSHYVWIGRILCVVILGGLGSFVGAGLGGALLGLGEALTATYIDTQWATTVPYVLIIAILLTRPQGLLGGRLPMTTSVVYSAPLIVLSLFLATVAGVLAVLGIAQRRRKPGLN